MDIEKPLRKELISLLSNDFDCFEEVDLYSSRFQRDVRCDVLAIAKDELLGVPLTFAFEVKKIQQWSVGKYCDAMHQAYGYVAADVKKLSVIPESKVDAAFVFPSPRWAWKDAPNTHDEGLVMSGISMFAGRLNVGQAKLDLKNRLGLFMGAAEIWISGKGWGGQAPAKFPGRNILTPKMIDDAAREITESL
jgi:hypothetical protein